jgi:hypothetical protein
MLQRLSQTKLLVNLFKAFQLNIKSLLSSTTREEMMLSTKLKKRKETELLLNNNVVESVRLLRELQNSKD